MRISVEAANGELQRLIEAAAQGEEVVLSLGDVPVARIVPIAATPFRVGILTEQVLGQGPDWFTPMSEEELALWEGEH